MKLGLLYLPTYVPELDGSFARFYGRMLDQVARADELGFDAVWLTEHHFDAYGGTLPNPAVMGAAIAQRTRRLRIGAAVSVLPLHNPLLVAEDYAMLDVLSGGRLDFGIGRGSTPPEFEQFGIGIEAAGEVMREAIALILRAWRDESFTFQGQHFQYLREISLLPRPVQQPHPPVWVGASRTPESFAWAGQHGFHLMVLPYMMEPALMRERLQGYFEALRAAGHDPARAEIMAKFHVFVADSEAEARRYAAPAYDHYQRLSSARSGRDQPAYWRTGASYDQHVAEYRVIAGTPAQCIERILYWRRELGITHLGGTFHYGGLAQDATLRSLELFAREVAPAVRAAPGPDG